jgi:hypothetical protein
MVKENLDGTMEKFILEILNKENCMGKELLSLIMGTG